MTYAGFLIRIGPLQLQLLKTISQSLRKRKCCCILCPKLETCIKWGCLVWDLLVSCCTYSFFQVSPNQKNSDTDNKSVSHTKTSHTSLTHFPPTEQCFLWSHKGPPNTLTISFLNTENSSRVCLRAPIEKRKKTFILEQRERRSTKLSAPKVCVSVCCLLFWKVFMVFRSRWAIYDLKHLY